MYSVFGLSFNIAGIYTESSRISSCKSEFYFLEVVLRLAIVARRFSILFSKENKMVKTITTTTKQIIFWQEDKVTKIQPNCL